ncbi:helix-turn-helix transcriptional regulator, partial [Acinetobacter junii]
TFGNQFNSFIFKFWGVSLSTHNVLSYAKRIDEICLGEWWQSKRWLCVSRILVAIQPLSLSDPLTSEKFKQLCQKELDELVATQDILYRVKQLIDDPIEGLLGIDQVAQKLNLTKRTLQRMLQEKSVSFQSLYDDVRKTKAQKLMLSPFASKDQIAKQLGYASTSSFNRAVKRWALE